MSYKQVKANKGEDQNTNHKIHFGFEVTPFLDGHHGEHY